MAENDGAWADTASADTGWHDADGKPVDKAALDKAWDAAKHKGHW